MLGANRHRKDIGAMSIQNRTDRARKTDALLPHDILYALKYSGYGKVD
jgi:hypothetical protein